MKALPTIISALALGILSGPADALDLSLPSTARLTAEVVTELGQFGAPVGVFADGHLPVATVQGRIDRKAWRIATAGLTPLQVLMPLRLQLEELGYRVSFECDARSCGGFDFRFATEVLPGPNMYVDLSRFHYMTAFLGPEDAPRGAVGLLASVADASAYLQIIHADIAAAPGPVEVPASVTTVQPVPEPAPQPQPHDMQTQLRQEGRVVLRDLQFASGTSNLDTGPYPSLSELAAFLLSDDTIRVALVGHTDTVGALDANIALSRARAASVRARLVEEYGVLAEQMDAEGMGYLAPVASNLTADGRKENRRVEAVLLSLE